jgi:hypothetical protein
MKGSASLPSSATMKGTRYAISEATNATSRESRSSLGHYHRTVLCPAGCERCCKLGASIERIGTLAGLDLPCPGMTGNRTLIWPLLATLHLASCLLRGSRR